MQDRVLRMDSYIQNNPGESEFITLVKLGNGGAPAPAPFALFQALHRSQHGKCDPSKDLDLSAFDMHIDAYENYPDFG
jgi:hypothetical protein